MVNAEQKMLNGGLAGFVQGVAAPAIYIYIAPFPANVATSSLFSSCQFIDAEV